MDHRSHTISNSNFFEQLKRKTRSNKATRSLVHRLFRQMARFAVTVLYGCKLEKKKKKRNVWLVARVTLPLLSFRYQPGKRGGEACQHNGAAKFSLPASSCSSTEFGSPDTTGSYIWKDNRRNHCHKVTAFHFSLGTEPAKVNYHQLKAMFEGVCPDNTY